MTAFDMTHSLAMLNEMPSVTYLAVDEKTVVGSRLGCKPLFVKCKKKIGHLRANAHIWVAMYNK